MINGLKRDQITRFIFMKLTFSKGSFKQRIKTWYINNMNILCNFKNFSKCVKKPGLSHDHNQTKMMSFLYVRPNYLILEICQWHNLISLHYALNVTTHTLTFFISKTNFWNIVLIDGRTKIWLSLDYYGFWCFVRSIYQVELN
jgi:hypothetical protein